MKVKIFTTKTIHNKIISCRSNINPLDASFSPKEPTPIFTDPINAAQYLLATRSENTILSTSHRMRLLTKAGKTQGRPLYFRMAGSAVDLFLRTPILREVEPFSDPYEAAFWLYENREEIKRQSGVDSLNYTCLALIVGGKAPKNTIRYARSINYAERQKDFLISTIVESFKTILAAKGEVTSLDIENRLKDLFHKGTFPSLAADGKPIRSYETFYLIIQICIRLHRNTILERLSRDERQYFPIRIFGRQTIEEGPIVKDINHRQPFFQYNNVRFSFRDDYEMLDMIKRQRCQAVLREDRIILRNCVTRKEWHIRIDSNGYLMGNDGEPYKIKGKSINVFKRGPEENDLIFVGFWRIALKRDVPTGERIRTNAFREEIGKLKGNIQASATTDGRGTIHLNINGSDCYIWNIAMKRRLRNKAVTLVAHNREGRLVISVFEKKTHPLYVDDFYFDPTFNRFYRIMKVNGTIIRSYIEIVTEERQFTYGAQTFFLSDKSVPGEAWHVNYEGETFKLAHNAEQGSRLRRSPAFEIVRDGQNVGYILSRTWPTRDINITGEVRKPCKIFPLHDSLVYRLRKRYYFLPTEDKVKAKIHEWDEVYPEFENGMVVSARIAGTSHRIHNTLVRDKNWNLLSNMGYTRDRSTLSDKRIIEGIYTCKYKIRDNFYEGVNIGGIVYSLGVPITGKFVSRRVSLVVDLSTNFPRGKRRVVFWRPQTRFNYKDRLGAVIAADLPPLAVEQFREKTKDRRRELANALADIFRRSESPNQIISRLKDYIAKQNLSSQDIVHLIDIINFLSMSEEIEPETRAMFHRVFEGLPRVLDDERINHEDIFKIMYAHQELRDQIQAIRHLVPSP